MGVKININTQCGIAANYFMEQLTSVEEKSFYWPYSIVSYLLHFFIYFIDSYNNKYHFCQAVDFPFGFHVFFT